MYKIEVADFECDENLDEKRSGDSVYFFDCGEVEILKTMSGGI